MFKQYFRKWASKRFKLEQGKTLGQRDILIFIYQQGYLYLVLILITFIAGINYANNLILGFCFLITSILCLSFYLTFKQLHQIEIQIALPEVGRVGQPIKIQIHLKQPSVSPRFIFLQIEEQIHPILMTTQNELIELSCSADKRGKWQPPAFKLFSTYPFGLVRAWTYIYCQQGVWLAPQAEIAEVEFDAAHSLGQPDQDEFRELRSYQLGDALPTISWKQLARGQGMYVKQFEDQRDFKHIEIDYEHMPSNQHEQKLSLMMGLVDQCELQQIPYSLKVKHALLAQGIGEKQLSLAQLHLAQVD